MKKLSNFRSSLLVSAVALSILSSPANAVSEDLVLAYWDQHFGDALHMEIEVLNKLTALNDAQWAQFQTTTTSLMTQDMEGYYRTKIINALVTMPSTKLFDNRFIGTVRVLSEGGKQAECDKVIKALEEITTDRLFDERFLSIVKILQKYIPNSQALSLYRGLPNELASWVLPQSSARIEEMNVRYGQHMIIVPFSLITVLGNIPSEKVDRVYGNIVRLMKNTEDRIWFERCDPAFECIIQLVKFDTDERAAAFTTALIELINRDPVNVHDDEFLTHMDTAWNRVRSASQNELQELARQLQSTHKKEVHASVAASVEELLKKYKNQLPEGDIFEIVHAAIMSVFPNNIEELLVNAVTTAKALLAPEAIDGLLKISPHTRTGEGNADTALNLAARRLWKDKSPETIKAIQEIVRLHSQKETFGDALKLLETLKRNSDFKDGISQIGYEPLLRLIYAAITDESWGDSKDISGRWRSLLNRMSRAQNEYNPGSQACLAGLFNALLEPLSDAHPDVLIIHSFHLMMEEIALEPSEKEYKRRVDLALSYLGPKAREDQDYMKVIAEVTFARMERQLEEQDPETKLLEGLRTSLDSLKELSDKEFEEKEQNLVGALPQTLQDQPLLWKSVVAQARKARAEERENTIQPRGLGSHPSTERQS